MFPIVDRDGIAKPAILLIVEEALNAGLTSDYYVQGRVLPSNRLNHTIEITTTAASLEAALLDMGRQVVRDPGGTGRAGARGLRARGRRRAVPANAGDHLYRPKGRSVRSSWWMPSPAPCITCGPGDQLPTSARHRHWLSRDAQHHRIQEKPTANIRENLHVPGMGRLT
jgi:hypothetical protein